MSILPSFLSRLGDDNGVGGKLTIFAKSVIAEGFPVATHPNILTPHPGGPHHAAAKTIFKPTDATIIVEGKPIVKVGTLTTCGHPIMSGATTIIVP